ncbi:predicted protein, partial [Nematostella vectensis]
GSSSDKTKIDTVCDACREALQNLGKEKYLLSILTSYAKKTEPELETVLSIIRDLKNKQADTSLGVTSEEALKYVLFLVDVNQMFDVALGMYDFQLVLMVAEKSQKSTKRRKNRSDANNNCCKRHMTRTVIPSSKRDLRVWSKPGSEHFHELVTLVKEKSLYKEALKLYSKTTKEYQDISICYGKHLFEKKKYEEAGIGCRSERSTTAQHSENFTKYKERLHIVRETKERLRIELLENGTLRDDTDADIFSDTSSITGQSGFGSSVGSKGTRSTGLKLIYIEMQN